jgi:hypothetical protein
MTRRCILGNVMCHSDHDYSVEALLCNDTTANHVTSRRCKPQGDSIGNNDHLWTKFALCLQESMSMKWDLTYLAHPWFYDPAFTPCGSWGTFTIIVIKPGFPQSIINSTTNDFDMWKCATKHRNAPTSSNKKCDEDEMVLLDSMI